MNDLIMIVEDDPYISHFLQMSFEQEGYRILMTTKGHEALSLFYSHQPDIVILDLGLPDIDGLEVIQEIRKISSKPIIVVSARLEEQEKIKALDLGANDYVVKPFSPKELMMRIKVLISRTKTPKEEHVHETFEKEGLFIDFTGRVVTVNGERVNMSPREYELLFYLVKNRNIALEREKLITDVWGYDYYGDDRTLDTHIKLLRNSLGEYRKFLVTLRGVGYRFEA